MESHEVQLITISREFGAGGSELAEAVAQRIGWPVLDRDIVHRVAERLRLDDGTVEKFDEHPPSLLARIATVLIVPQPDMYTFPETENSPSHDAIASATRAVIEELAKSPPLIIVGHGAQVILADRSDVLNVRIVAPIGDRLARIRARLGVDPAHAANLLRRADQDRQEYLHRYFRRDWRDPQLYDVQINTGNISIDEAGGMIAGLVAPRSKNARSTPVLPLRK